MSTPGPKQRQSRFVPVFSLLALSLQLDLSSLEQGLWVLTCGMKPSMQRAPRRECACVCVCVHLRVCTRADARTRC